MANAQILKRRIRSISNTRQITKAMELVSAAKMRRVVVAVERSRAYSDATIDILRRLSSSVEAAHHPYFSPPVTKTKLYVLFTSDSGLAGAYNSNVFSFAAKAFGEDHAKGLQPVVIAFGRKGAHHFSHVSDVNLEGEYEKVADDPDANVFAPVLEFIVEGIAETKFSSVDLIYTEFRSTMNQQVTKLQLIPVSASDDDKADLPDQVSATPKKDNLVETVFEFEPDAEAVLESALRLYFESSLRRARVESAASEHAMRMMSMNNANRNAGDLIDNLTLDLNATRQAAITQEMAEIIGGANAIT